MRDVDLANVLGASPIWYPYSTVHLSLRASCIVLLLCVTICSCMPVYHITFSYIPDIYFLGDSSVSLVKFPRIVAYETSIIHTGKC